MPGRTAVAIYRMSLCLNLQNCELHDEDADFRHYPYHFHHVQRARQIDGLRLSWQPLCSWNNEDTAHDLLNIKSEWSGYVPAEFLSSVGSAFDKIRDIDLVVLTVNMMQDTACNLWQFSQNTMMPVSGHPEDHSTCFCTLCLSQFFDHKLDLDERINNAWKHSKRFHFKSAQILIPTRVSLV